MSKTGYISCRIDQKRKELLFKCAENESTSVTSFLFECLEIGLQQKHKERERNRRIISKLLN